MDLPVTTTPRPTICPPGPVDLIVVGAGIVGLAHAAEALSRGMSVHVIERDQRAAGASVQNFGHGCITAQDGLALELAMAARQRWIDLGAAAGFWVGTTGTLVVARADDEMAVLQQFASARGSEQVHLLAADEVFDIAPVGCAGVVGGAFLPLDLRVDARTAVPALAAWLAQQDGVSFEWSTSVAAVRAGAVETSRGVRSGAATVVCTGHDVDRLFPDLADAAGAQRCQLHMLTVAAPHGRRYDPAILSGTSMLRYAGMASQPAAEQVRARYQRQAPHLLEATVNLMLTQRPDGDLVIGDTHAYGATHDAFSEEDLDALLLGEAARLLGVEHLEVRQRWLGVYASAPGEYLVAQPHPGTAVVTVTSGIGMTTAHGLAPRVLDQLAAATTPTATPAMTPA